MYLKFSIKEECQACLIELNKRMGLNGNVTSKFCEIIEDNEGNFLINKPSERYMQEIKQLVRNVDVAFNDDEGNYIINTMLQVVSKQYDEQGNDITEYTGDEYELVQQEALNDFFEYEEVEEVSQ